MAKRPKTKPDPAVGVDPPTVAEIRAIRRRMWKEAGGTLDGPLALARRETAELKLHRTPRKRRSRGGRLGTNRRES